MNRTCLLQACCAQGALCCLAGGPATGGVQAGAPRHVLFPLPQCLKIINCVAHLHHGCASGLGAAGAGGPAFPPAALHSHPSKLAAQTQQSDGGAALPAHRGACKASLDFTSPAESPLPRPDSPEADQRVIGLAGARGPASAAATGWRSVWHPAAACRLWAGALSLQAIPAPPHSLFAPPPITVCASWYIAEWISSRGWRQACESRRSAAASGARHAAP